MKMQMRTQLQRFGAVVALAFAISGCWDGAIRARVTPSTITVIDGYISGAVVCVDKNNNASCDDDETIRGTTDADGKVTLDVPEDEIGKYPIVAYVPIGATDAVTGKVTQAFTLRAPAASPNMVTPYTTMVQSLIDEGYSFEEAFKSVAQKTGITEPTSDFTSNHKSSTLARTMVALQINRLHALENLSSCKASQSDKEKKVSSAIHSRVDNISATSDLITTCTSPVDQKTTTCQASIDNAVTSIVAANPALSTVSIQNSLSDTNCHKPPEQTAIIRGANSGGMSIGNDGRTKILDVTLIGEYTGETLGTDYSVQVMDNNVTAGVADKEESNKSWRLNLSNQAPGKHSYTAIVVRKSDSLQGAASSAFTLNVGNSVALSSNSPNVWDEFTLTLSHVWSSIQSVVFNFATDAAELADLTLSKTANLVGNVWDSVTTAFKTVGSKTIIAQFFDGTNGTGKALETNRLNLTVGPANVTLTANIIDVWDGSSRITEVSGQTTTSNTKPTISGTVSSVLGQYYVVKLYDNDVLLPGNMAYNTARTNWTFTPAAALSGGLYKLTAKVSTFDGGATGTASAIKSLVIRLPINDTGITADQCYGSDSDEFFRCTSSVAIRLSSQQDGMIGRDVSNNDDRDGKLGFSFSLVTRASGGNYDKTECVKDNITGLMWEGKPASGTRGSPALDPNDSYTNYPVGYVSHVTQRDEDDNLFTPDVVNTRTNAQGYVKAVNEQGLCGYTDWRLPTRNEMLSIVDYGVSSPGPTIDATWFLNTQSGFYWTSSAYLGATDSAWYIDFSEGSDNGLSWAGYFYVRLVR